MDAKAPENLSYELFELLSSFRNTVEGVLACNNQNVWNVFGGLSRTKKAVFNILVNGLRTSDNKDRCAVQGEDSSAVQVNRFLNFFNYMVFFF